MNKKAILIILALMIVCCICLVAVGILGILFYAGNEFATTLPDQDQAPTYSSTATPTEIFITPTVEIQPNIEEQENYIDDLYNEMLICFDTTVIWMDINEDFQADLNLLNDEQAVEDYMLILEQVRSDCASFTVMDNPPPEYESINNEVKMVNESGNVFIDNFLLYLDTQEKEYEDAGIEAAYEMNYHLEQLTTLVQEITPIE